MGADEANGHDPNVRDEEGSDRHATKDYVAKTVIELRHEIAALRVDVTGMMDANSRTMATLADQFVKYHEMLTDARRDASVLALTASMAQSELSELMKKYDQIHSEWSRLTRNDRTERPTDPQLVRNMTIPPPRSDDDDSDA